jgi:hypothetical protein
VEVDQKYITNVRLHDAKGSEIRVVKEGDDYHLQLVASHSVVNISMGPRDLRKLGREVGKLDLEEGDKSRYTCPPEFKSYFPNGMPRSFHDAMASWLSRLAGEVAEAPVKH